MQELDDAGVTKVTRCCESSSATVSSQSGICSSSRKLSHYLQMTIHARNVERATSVIIDLVDGCPPLPEAP